MTYYHNFFYFLKNTKVTLVFKVIKKMSEKESKRNKLLELLKTEPMTSKELAEKLEIPIDFVWVYLSQYTRNGKVIKVGKKGRFNLYKSIEFNPIELLKQLYELMDSKMDFVKKANDKDIELIKQIEQVIK